MFEESQFDCNVICWKITMNMRVHNLLQDFCRKYWEYTRRTSIKESEQRDRKFLLAWRSGWAHDVLNWGIIQDYRTKNRTWHEIYNFNCGPSAGLALVIADIILLLITGNLALSELICKIFRTNIHIEKSPCRGKGLHVMRNKLAWLGTKNNPKRIKYKERLMEILPKTPGWEDGSVFILLSTVAGGTGDCCRVLWGNPLDADKGRPPPEQLTSEDTIPGEGVRRV